MSLVNIAFVVSIVLTLWHLTEEFLGKLWRYFGAVAGVWIPDWKGIIAFTGLLGVTLIAAAVGILGMDGRFGGYGLSWPASGFCLAAEFRTGGIPITSFSSSISGTAAFAGIPDYFPPGFTWRTPRS
ncbi:MAG: hypothetical protein R3C14_30390 [Caldilineaceae bacterium]